MADLHKVIKTRSALIEPYFFGPPERRLFGIVTRPHAATEPTANLLVCYPIGHEYLNAHRSLARLAVKLADSGVTTLRFDYAGTGDSFDRGTAVGRVGRACPYGPGPPTPALLDIATRSPPRRNLPRYRTISCSRLSSYHDIGHHLVTNPPRTRSNHEQ